MSLIIKNPSLLEWIVENSPVLDVPEGTSVMELPLSHFVDLVQKKGRKKVVRGLTNLEVWFKYKNPELSKWAKKMKDDLNMKIGKDE